MRRPARTDLELDRFWRAVMGPLGFTTRRLWIVLLDADDRPVPQITEIDDVPDEVEPETCVSLMYVCDDLLSTLVPGGSVALLFSRPGRQPMGPGDREIARELATAAASVGVPLRPTHFANDVVLSVFAADDLLPRRRTA